MGGISAASNGAEIIEKHISLNKNIGTDSKFSLEIKELKNFISECKSAYKTKGNVFYGPTRNEIKSTKSIRTLFFGKNFSKGHLIKTNDILRKRPGLGIKVYNLSKIIGKKLKFKVKRGDPVKFKNFN